MAPPTQVSYEPLETSQALDHMIKDKLKGTTRQLHHDVQNKVWRTHKPVITMFLSMCLGVSPSSNSMEAGPGVLAFLTTEDVVLLEVAGRDFLVML